MNSKVLGDLPVAARQLEDLEAAALLGLLLRASQSLAYSLWAILR